ncbi:MAG: Gfo/Idh/MocA family oxidoreductase [Bacteroidales bacterium]|nr:Gfo/Idh/MocA family oxidoreductase [Bacteroidales bacterium]
MVKTIKIGVSGAGGYGYWYLKKILENLEEYIIDLAAVFDPDIENVEIYQELLEYSIPCYSIYTDFVKALSEVDLVIIASPIHFHARQTIDALNHGCNVLLEKPLAGSVEQAEEIIAVSAETGKWVMHGYQWSYSDAIRSLKSDLVNGKYGKINHAKTLVLWPRGFDYYSRNNWAGKMISEDGLAINDSPVNNAMAHFLHNLLFLTGDNMESSAVPIKGKAELYRIYPIETFDSAVVDLKTKNHTRIKIYFSHVTKNPKGPLFILECDKAVIYYGELSNDITALMVNGETKTYGDPENTDQFQKLYAAVETCRSGKEPICRAIEALQQTKVIQSLSNLEPTLCLDDSRIRDIPGERKYVDGLGYMLFSCYQQGVMPSKKGFHIKGKNQRFKI